MWTWRMPAVWATLAEVEAKVARIRVVELQPGESVPGWPQEDVIYMETREGADGFEEGEEDDGGDAGEGDGGSAL